MLLLQSANVRSCGDACGVHPRGIGSQANAAPSVARCSPARRGRLGWEGCCVGVASLRCGLALSASQRLTLPSRRCVCFARLRRRCWCSLHAQAHWFRRKDQVKPHCKCMQSLIKKTMVLAHQFQNLDQWQNIERAVLTNYFDSALCALCKTNERVCWRNRKFLFKHSYAVLFRCSGARQIEIAGRSIALRARILLAKHAIDAARRM